MPEKLIILEPNLFLTPFTFIMPESLIDEQTEKVFSKAGVLTDIIIDEVFNNDPYTNKDYISMSLVGNLKSENEQEIKKTFKDLKRKHPNLDEELLYNSIQIIYSGDKLIGDFYLLKSEKYKTNSRFEESNFTWLYLVDKEEGPLLIKNNKLITSNGNVISEKGPWNGRNISDRKSTIQKVGTSEYENAITMRSFFYTKIIQNQSSHIVPPSLIYKREKFTTDELTKYNTPFKNIIKKMKLS